MMSRDFRSVAKHSRAGLSLADMMIALGLMAVVTIGYMELNKGIGDISKQAKSTDTLLKVQNFSVQGIRNMDALLGQLRGSVETGAIFAGCLPDSSSLNPSYNCPPVDPDIVSQDPQIQELAGNVYSVSSVPIVDTNGRHLAGTTSAPKLFKLDGTDCNGARENCAFESTGYLLRSNPATDSDPGAVKLTVRLSSIADSAAGVPPTKPRYATVDLSQDWKVTSSPGSGGPASCPTGSVKIGYLPNGFPNCVSSSSNCNSGELAVGVDADGNALCEEVPSCPAGEHAVFSPTGSGLSCSNTSPCTGNTVFMGFESGTGAPICKSPDTQCAAGELQIGLNTSGSNDIEAKCTPFPTCPSTEYLTLIGEELVCQAPGAKPEITKFACLDSDGEIDETQEIYGVDEIGNALCRDRPEPPPRKPETPTLNLGACSSEYSEDKRFIVTTCDKNCYRPYNAGDTKVLKAPSTVSRARVDAIGAGGGHSGGMSGGTGGKASGTFAVSAGEEFVVINGCGGIGDRNHAHGGALSGLFRGSAPVSSDKAGADRAVIIAGGGGGACGGTYGAAGHGGNGGGLQGTSGSGGPAGGTQNSGGGRIQYAWSNTLGMGGGGYWSGAPGGGGGGGGSGFCGPEVSDCNLETARGAGPQGNGRVVIWWRISYFED